MLTSSERKWAIKKSEWIKRDICYLPDYPTKDELLDALEFSERCAVWLAKRCAAIEKAVQQLLGAAEYKDLDEAVEILLEGARLTVEEEMSNEAD